MKSEKQFYQQPLMKLAVLRTRSVLCQSGLEDYEKGSDITFDPVDD